MILIFSLLMVLGISVIALAMLSNARMSKASGLSYKNRLQSFYAADGMMTLIAQEIIDGRDSVYLAHSGSGQIKGELWTTYNYTGTQTVADFKAYASGHAGTGIAVTADYLGSRQKLSKYMIYWRGYIHPPLTGNYKFSVRADDIGGFYLSADDDPAQLSAKPICQVDVWNYKWPLSGKAVSDPQFLEAGKRYYFEFYQAQKGGGDHGDVGWEGPEWFIEKPILGQNISAYGSPKFNDSTATVGPRKVTYRVTSLGPSVFGIATQSFKALGKDTSYHSPLNQVLSLKGQIVTPPDILNMRAIFYDFHADKSNPEFETPWVYGVRTGMVKNKIDSWDNTNAGFFNMAALPKPSLGPSPHYNCSIGKWFRPWTAGDPWVASYLGVGSNCTPMNAGHDTAFKNIVFLDSLPFRRDPAAGTNAYVFSRSGGSSDSSFFWLSGKGFGNEGGLKDAYGTPQNFAFCMEMHTQFVHFSGIIFDFRGDDDVWVFVNDSLVMDLGGIHGAATGQVFFDDLNLEYGEQYNFDFYYCERHTTGSTIKIQTNLPIVRNDGKMTRAWKRDYGNL